MANEDVDGRTAPPAAPDEPVAADAATAEAPFSQESSRSGPLRSVMRAMGRLMPKNASGENARAVGMFRRVTQARDLAQRARRGGAWPVASGAYVVGDPQGAIAICALTSNDLLTPLAAIPGVAIAGRVYTPNLGVEKIILNVTANPAIRYLLLCGKESPVFHPGQALQALVTAGVTPERRIVGAVGHLPILGGVSLARIEAFRRQVELVERVGETSVDTITAQVADLLARAPQPAIGANVNATPDAASAMSSAPFADDAALDADLEIDTEPALDPAFTAIQPGGRREPLAYDPKGFFVITLDRAAGQIVCRHYLPDNTPAHEMRGHSAEGMLLGLLREGLVTQLSHAGYLGGELAKAEAALRLGLRYEQDQPLRTQP